MEMEEKESVSARNVEEAESGTTESMKDYEKELEASFRKIGEGDIIKGTVIDVNEEEVILDLKYYAQGIIKAENLSNDPDFLAAGKIAVVAGGGGAGG